METIILEGTWIVEETDGSNCMKCKDKIVSDMWRMWENMRTGKGKQTEKVMCDNCKQHGRS